MRAALAKRSSLEFDEEARTKAQPWPYATVGGFTIKRKIKSWHKSPLGVLYYPNYIHDGVAIHGNPSVPTGRASYGCIRIPMFAAQEFSERAISGMVVLIYDKQRCPPVTETLMCARRERCS